MTAPIASNRLVIVVFGAKGSVWNGKMGKALQKIVGKTGTSIDVWGVDKDPVKGQQATMVTRWFSVDQEQDLQTLETEYPSVSMAIIASWNETHIPLLLHLLGKVPFVLVEKPLSDDLAAAERALPFIEAAVGRTSCLCIDHYVAKAAVQKLVAMKQQLQGLGIGDLQSIRFSMREARSIESGREHLLARGLFQDLLIHGFQIVLELVPRCMDDPVTIEAVFPARYEHAPISAETAGRVEAELPGGVHATFLVGKATLDEKTLEIHGSEGKIVADISTGQVSHYDSASGKNSTLQPLQPEEAYATALAEAIRLVRTGGKASSATSAYGLIEPRKALRALELVESVRVAAAGMPMESHPVGTVPSNMALRRHIRGCMLEVYHSTSEASLAVVREIMHASREAISQRGRFVLVMPGGTSFLEASRILAYHAGDLDMGRFEVFLTDEHAGLAAADPENNLRIAREQGGFDLLLKTGGLPLEALHAIPTEDDTGTVYDETALRCAHIAEKYEAALRIAVQDGAGPDLLILGMGTDCHTASILPEIAGWTNPLSTSQSDYQVVCYPTAYGLRSSLRVSITVNGIRSARKVILLAFGSKKCAALKAVLTKPVDLARRPASVTRLVNALVIADQEATVWLGGAPGLPMGCFDEPS